MQRFLCTPLLACLFGVSAFVAVAQTPSSLPAGGGHYSITQDGKTLGDAQYEVAAIAGGSTLTSSGQMKLKNFSYSFHNTATVDAQNNLVRDQLTGSVHGAKASGNNIQFDTASDASGRSFTLTVNADSKKTTNSVDRHRRTVLAPDLDPGAYTLMARLALQRPQSAWVLIPKENGILVPAEYTLDPDLNGTWNGKSVTVKHAIVALSDQNSIVIELFMTGDGQLLEADLNAQNFYVVRDGFKLLNRPKPTAPPHGQAPPQNGQQTSGPPQQSTQQQQLTPQ